MKRRITFVIFAAAALTVCFSLMGFHTGVAAGASQTAAPASLVNEYSADTALSQNTTWAGDVRVDSGVTLDLNGYSMTISGSLEVFGTLHVNNGYLKVSGGSIVIDGGLLQILPDTTASALNSSLQNTVSVSGGNFVARGRDETGSLTAGKVTVKGNFIQDNAYSSKSYCPAGTSTVLSGSGLYVSFASPDGSWLGPYDFSGTTFNALSNFSLALSLSSDTTLSYANLSIRGQLNGKSLTVPANTVVAGPLTVGGQLTASGSFTVGVNGGINMTGSGDKLTVNGNFQTMGVCNIQNGTVTINGNFTQFGPVAITNGHENSWVSQSASVTHIQGANRFVTFQNPDTSCFGQLVLDSGASLDPSSLLSLNFDLTADTTLNYNVSSVYYGGRLNTHTLTALGCPFYAARQITLGGGTLDVETSLTASAANALLMTNGNDRVIVKGNFVSSGKVDAGVMTAGEIDLYGNFTQTGNPASFVASGSHVTKFFKTGAKVQFATPSASWFGKVAMGTEAMFDASSTVSMRCDLDSDRAFNVAVLYYGGNLNGYTLTENGALHITGATNPLGGMLKATGAVTLDGALTMATSGDRLEAGGDFTGAGTAALGAGSVLCKAGFHYSGVSYLATGSNVTTFSGGAGISVVFDNPSQSYFAGVTLASGTSLSASSKLSIRSAGLSDLTLSVPTLYLQGTLAGKSVNLTGSMDVPAGATLSLGGGLVNVSGSVTLDGLLIMTNANDRLTVGGSLTAQGPNETNALTNGKLTVKGNFTQLSTLSDKSFVCTLAHKTILSGASAQSVSFDSANSTFGKLYQLNNSVSYSAPGGSSPTNCSLAYTRTSAGLLNNLTSDAGGRIYPDFNTNTYDYVYVLPDSASSVTFTANMLLPGQPGYETVVVGATTYSANPIYATVNNVQLGSPQTVTFVAKAADDVVENTYTIKVEKLDLNLKSINLSGSATLSPAFNSDTTTYTASLPAAQEAVTITPLADSSESAFYYNIYGLITTGPSKTLALKPGETLKVDIVVTGQDGEHTKTYTVNVSRNSILAGFGQSPDSPATALSPAFSASLPAYTLTLKSYQSSVSITPVKATECTSLKIDGVVQDSAGYTLKLGEAKTVTVTAYAGSAYFTYTITLKRSPIISGFYDPSQQRAGMTLSPAFDAEGNSGSGPFTLTVPASVTSLTIDPVLGDCSNITINDGTKDYSYLESLDSLQPGASITLTIVATENDSGHNISRTFTLTVKKNPVISGLTPSDGVLTQKADPTKHTFDPTVSDYMLDVPATGDPVSVSPTLFAGTETVTVNGTAWDSDNPVTVNPAPGATALLTIVGKSGTGTGSNTSTYRITVTRHNPLTGIALSTGALTPAFNAATDTYTVSLPITTSSVTITPTKNSNGSCTALKINGVTQNSISVPLALGGSADILIEATSADSNGATVSQYHVLVDRETLISDVSVTSGDFSPDYDGCTLKYSLFLPSTTASVTLTPVKTASCSTFTINGKAVSKLKVSIPAGGESDVTIYATGNPSSYTQSFVINIYRIAPVTAIALSTGKLSPAFTLAQTAYTVSVPASAASVTVTPTKATSCASLTIDGDATKTSVKLTPAIGGQASTTIKATAVDGSQFTWTVTVARAAMLKGITLSSGCALAPAFAVSTLSYNVNVSAMTSSVKVTPQKATGCTMTINGHSVSSVTLTPPVGGSSTATIVLTATGGTVKQTYTVSVNRAPLLTGITPSIGTISPAFDPAKTAYTVTIPADSPQTTLAFARAATGVKSISVGTNGVDVTSADVPVGNPGDSATLTVVATATDGTTKATYTVTVKRAPVLSAIQVAGGTLSPAFSPDKTSYTVSIPATVSKVTLTPIGTADCTSISIDSAPGAPTATKDYYPKVGETITTTILAKTAGGASRTYTVKIVRAPLLKSIKSSTSSCPLTPAFSSTTLTYTVSLPSSKSSITISAAKAASNVTMTINGKKVSSLLVKVPAGSSTDVLVTVTMTDSATHTTVTVTYKVTVTRAP